jgi:hypothetical protein
MVGLQRGDDDCVEAAVATTVWRRPIAASVAIGRGSIPSGLQIGALHRREHDSRVAEL